MTGRIVSAALWVLTTPFVLRVLGAERFAFWALCFALTGYVAALDFGVGNAVARHVALENAEGDLGAARRTLVHGILIALGLGAIWACTAWLGRDWILLRFHVPDFAAAEARMAIGLFAGALVLGGLSQVLLGALTGFERLDRYNAAFLSGVLVHTVLLVVGLARGGGLVSAALAAIAGQGTQLAVGGALLAGLAPWASAGPARRRFPWRSFVGFGAAVQGTNASATGLTQAPRILLGMLGNLRVVAEFELGMRLAMTVWSVAAIMQGALIGTAARVSATGSIAALREVYLWTSRWMVALASWAFGALWVTAPALLALWLGPGHEASVPHARDMAIAFTLLLVAGPAMALARGAGWPVLEALMAAAALLLQLALGLWLIPRLGARGAPVALGVAVAIAGAWLIALVHARIELRNREWLGRLVLPRFAGAVAAAALAHAWPMTLPDGRLAALQQLAILGGLYSVLYLAFTWWTGDARSVAGALRPSGGVLSGGAAT